MDDIIIVCSSSSATKKLIEKLLPNFAVKDLGPLEFFMGIEVKQESDGILLSWNRYSLDLLKKENMEHCKAIATLMSACDNLLKDQGTALVDNE